MALADFFVKQLSVCDENLNAASVVFVANIDGCNEEPRLYEINVPAITAGDTTANLSVVGATDDGVAVSPVPTAYIVREGQVIYVGTESFVVTATTTIDDTGVDVPIEAENAVSAGTAFAWQMEELTTVTDVPLNLSSTTENSTVLRNGLQGSSNKTKIELSIAMQVISTNRDLAVQRIIAPAAQGSNNIYFVVAKSSGYTGFGRAQVTDFSITGSRETQEEISFTLNAQAPFGLAYATSDTTINDTNQLNALTNLVAYSGLPSFS